MLQFFCRALFYFLVVISKDLFIKLALGDTIEHSVDTMEQVQFNPISAGVSDQRLVPGGGL